MVTDLKAQVLGAVDVVELISRSVALKRSGKDYLGLCPFHQEKSPSFHVSPTRQAFYCFGCKAGGNAIDFVMRRDRIEFKDALELLASDLGIEIPRGGRNNGRSGERQALVDAHVAAARFFEKMFASDLGAAARDYLARRGFTPQTLTDFGLGWAPGGWDALLKSAECRRISPQVLALAGLVKPKQRGDGFYDTFRERVMFPIRDEAGRIIAFGGRILPGSEEPAKYLNSPETPLFSKSRSIFGLDRARQRIVETRTVAVVEGYTDVLGAHQAGATNVVSVLGTALTEQHVGVLRRFADRIVLLFDADTAGDKAVDRAMQLFLSQPVEIAVASMPDGVDPDEYVLEHGAEAFSALLAGAIDALSYAWRRFQQRFASSEDDLTGQQKAVEEFLGLLAAARGEGPIDGVRWGAALTRVSRLTEIPVEQLHQRLSRSKARPAVRPALGNAARNGNGQPGGEQSSPAGTEVVGEAMASPEPTAQDSCERWILGALLLEPSRWHDVQHQVHVEDFANPMRRRLADVYWEHQRDEGEPVFNEFLAAVEEPALRALAVEVVHEVERLEDLSAALTSAMEHLAEVRRKRQEQKLVADVRQADEQEQILLLHRIAENARRPDLRRVGR